MEMLLNLDLGPSDPSNSISDGSFKEKHKCDSNEDFCRQISR
jgi:hypothetical protein